MFARAGDYDNSGEGDTSALMAEARRYSKQTRQRAASKARS
jgi:hypothetical protein